VSKDEAGAFRLWVNTEGWTVDKADRFVIDLLEVVEDYGSTAHVEIPLMAFVQPIVQWATGEADRCMAVKDKAYHQPTTNPARSRQGSSWRCGLIIGHDGQHMAPASAKQAPW
jgi:hypothetical protein